ncbi:MAG: alpha/beta fold hydrolase [Anaerolineae bacterium]|nr:alpha/beta fold hydrolase [Anaerolineae bacterium]
MTMKPARWFIGFIVCLMVLGRGVQPASAEGISRFEAAPCPFANITAIRIECGWITVPENHAEPEGRQIRLAIAIIRALGANRQPDPVLYLAGGPGAGVVWMAPRFAVELAQTARDIVLIDQRGMGYSEPGLYCPMISEWMLLSNTPIEPEIRACRAQLEAKGVRVQFYNTEQNAADIAVMRQALGYDQVNLFGVSYGTHLALAVLRDHPTGIRSVTLDSTHPLQTMYTEETGTPSGFERSFSNLETLCQQDTACRLAYPDLRATYLSAYDRLNHEPHVVQTAGQSIRLNGALFETLVFTALYRPASVATLPALIYSVADGDDRLLSQALEPAVKPAAGQGRSLGTTLTIFCSENALLIGHQPPAIHPAFANPLPALNGEAAIRNCHAWGIDQAQRQALALNNDVPVLILAGEYDPVTPPENGLLAAQTLAKATYIRFPKLGHGISDSACGGAIYAQFLDHPTAAVDTSCTHAITPPAFTFGAGRTRPIMLGLIVLLTLVSGGGLGAAGWTALRGQYHPAWRATFHKIGWLPAVISTASILFPDAYRVVIPLMAGIQASAIFAPDDEPALEIQLAAPRSILWLVGERLTVVLLVHGSIALLGTLITSTGVPVSEAVVRLTQIVAPLVFLSGIGLFIALRTRIPLFGMLVIGLLCFGFTTFGEFFLPGKAFGVPVNLIQPFLWTIHLYLQPSDMGIGYFWLNRIALISSGFTLGLLASRALMSPERILMPNRGGKADSVRPHVTSSVSPSRLLWTPQPVQIIPFRQLMGVIRYEYRLAWRKRQIIVGAVTLFVAVLLGGTLISSLISGAMLVNPTTLSVDQARHMATLTAIMSLWPFLSAIFLFVAPLLAADAIPYDRQTGMLELLRGLSFTVYAVGKAIGVLLTLLTVGAGALVFSVALWWIKTGGLDWLPFLDMWLVGGGMALLLNVPLAVLLGSTQPNRLRAAGIVFAVFALFAALTAIGSDVFWLVSPLRSALFDYYLNLFANGVLNPANLTIPSGLTAPDVRLTLVFGVLELLVVVLMARVVCALRSVRG